MIVTVDDTGGNGINCVHHRLADIDNSVAGGLGVPREL